jgi:hypothetical protein
MRHSGQHSVTLGMVVDDKAACALASGDCDISPGQFGLSPGARKHFSLNEARMRTALHFRAFYASWMSV